MSLHTENAEGTLLGLATGDRIGGPTAMAFALAECLIDERAFSPEAVLGAYLAWWKRDGRDSGPTAALVLRALQEGLSRQDAVRYAHEAQHGRSAGCNPVHRAAPLSMAVFLSDEQLTYVAQTEAKLTHFDPIAGQVSAAYVLLLRGLLRGYEWSRALEWVHGGTEAEVARWLEIPGRGALRPDGFAPHVLGAALHFVGHAASCEEALVEAFDFAGGLNYSPVLTGALAGARWGSDAVPDQLPSAAEVQTRASRLAASLSYPDPDEG